VIGCLASLPFLHASLGHHPGQHWVTSIPPHPKGKQKHAASSRIELSTHPNYGKPRCGSVLAFYPWSIPRMLQSIDLCPWLLGSPGLQKRGRAAFTETDTRPSSAPWAEPTHTPSTHFSLRTTERQDHRSEPGHQESSQCRLNDVLIRTSTGKGEQTLADTSARSLQHIPI